MGYYTFSVRNNLREPIKDVVCLIIFYARDGLPIETEFVTIRGPVSGNLASHQFHLTPFDAIAARAGTAT